MQRQIDFVLLALLSLLLVLPVYGETVYFIAGEISPNHNESFIVPISDANDIAHARDLIEFGHGIGQTIICADINCGIAEFNRDYFASGKPVWSWYITDFNGFADITIGILDGWPGYVQSDCEGWIANAGGHIGFWNYTIVAELGTTPLHWDCDFTSDGKNNMDDFARFAKYWLHGCSTSECNGVDLDDSGVVDNNDLAILEDCWLSPFAVKPVEPFSFSDCWNCPTQCHGDVDCNGDVGLADFYAIEGFSLPAYYGSLDYDPCLDFNRDLVVDNTDVNILLSWYGTMLPEDCP